MRVWTVEKIREIERIAIQDLGVSSLILMENAGSGAAGHVLQVAENKGVESIAVVCGAGNNGGDGLVVARHLALRGLSVVVELVVDPAGRSSEDFRTNLGAARGCDVPIREAWNGPAAIESGSLVVDGLLGTGARGAPRAPFDAWIEAANGCGGPIVALDVPSGLDAATGEGPGAIRATATVTFVAAKPGFYRGDGPECCGEIILQDISIPRRLLADD